MSVGLRNRTETCLSPCSFFFFISVKQGEAGFPVMSRLDLSIRCTHPTSSRLVLCFAAPHLALCVRVWIRICCVAFCLQCLPTNCISLLDSQLYNRTHSAIRGSPAKHFEKKSYFRLSMELHTLEHSRINEIKRIDGHLETARPCKPAC
jgi:hypothetical protein